MRETGKIKAALRGFAFIRPDQGGADIFLHCTSMKGGAEIPEIGCRISYDVEPAAKGPRAINAELIDAKADAANVFARVPKFGDELGAG